MSLPRLSRRTLMLVAAIIPLALLFGYVAVRSGPLAPIEVTTISVAKRSIAPALYGIGSVQARYSYRIGPTYAGRLQRLDVHVGDAVEAGQVLGAMAPVDLDDRIGAQQAAIASAQAALQQAQARQRHAQAQDSATTNWRSSSWSAWKPRPRAGRSWTWPTPAWPPRATTSAACRRSATRCRRSAAT